MHSIISSSSSSPPRLRLLVFSSSSSPSSYPSPHRLPFPFPSSTPPLLLLIPSSLTHSYLLILTFSPPPTTPPLSPLNLLSLLQSSSPILSHYSLLPPLIPYSSPPLPSSLPQPRRWSMSVLVIVSCWTDCAPW